MTATREDSHAVARPERNATETRCARCATRFHNLVLIWYSCETVDNRMRLSAFWGQTCPQSVRHRSVRNEQVAQLRPRGAHSAPGRSFDDAPRSVATDRDGHGYVVARTASR